MLKRIIFAAFAAFACTLGIHAQRSQVVEDGGTGPYKAIMKEEASLTAHTIFVPQDLSAFGRSRSSLYWYGVMVLAITHHSSTTSS